jgi:hypothetical protein
VGVFLYKNIMSENNSPNKNGANQYQMDPRQKLCWDLYINPKSKTFGNAYQSAMKAGYEEATAAQITCIEWFKDKCRRLNLLNKAEKVLEECLEMPICTTEFQGYGEGKEEVVVTNPALVKIKQDTAKFIASTQGKDEGYSTRSELTGKDGKDLVPKPILKEIEDGISSDNSDKKDNVPPEADQSSAENIDKLIE